MIKAFGKTFTPEEARARVSALKADNERLGASDDRVTELNALETQLRDPYNDPKELERRRFAEERVREAQRELSWLGGQRNVPGDHRVSYYEGDSGTLKVARYTTEDGFLRGLIRLYGNPSRYSVFDVF